MKQERNDTSLVIVIGALPHEVHAHIKGQRFMPGNSLSLSLSHTHTHTHKCWDFQGKICAKLMFVHNCQMQHDIHAIFTLVCYCFFPSGIILTPICCCLGKWGSFRAVFPQDKFPFKETERNFWKGVFVFKIYKIGKGEKQTSTFYFCNRYIPLHGLPPCCDEGA